MLRTNIILVLLAIFSASCATDWDIPDTAKYPAEIDIVSLNIHYLVPEWDSTNWDARKYAVTEMLNTVNADIVIFQEMETFHLHGSDPHTTSHENIQLDWIMRMVPNYTAGAIGNADEFPITQPILYRSDRFTLLRQGFFYYSPTPDVIYSRPWNGGYPAFSTWMHLRDTQTEEEFIVLNSHLDAFNGKNRSDTIELIMKRLPEISRGLPVIAGGDYNMLTTDPILVELTSIGLKYIPMQGSSFHFGRGLHLYPSIDHFYISPEWEVKDGGVMQKKWPSEEGMPGRRIAARGGWNPDWPSDHHPVFARLLLQ
ncbi:MAG: endonuclease/exonuclease/phosphatase family protein [Salinispira sp.]